MHAQCFGSVVPLLWVQRLCCETALESACVQVSGCLPWLGHRRAPGRRPESVDARNRGVQGAAAAATYRRAYGDLKKAPVAARGQHTGASGCFSAFGRRTDRKRGAGMPPVGVDGGDFELLRGFLWQAPAWPGQAQRQSRPISGFGSSNGVMTYRPKLALRLAAGIGAWRRERRPR